MFELLFTHAARQQLESLERAPSQAGLVRQVKQSLGYLQSNPRHPSLHTHAYQSLAHPYRLHAPVFEAYAQHHTPSAYRIFWCYGPAQHQLTIIAITPHP